MKRKIFALVSAVLLSAVGCLESFAKSGPSWSWTSQESPSYANMRPLENMSAADAISIMKNEYFFQEEYPIRPWICYDDIVFDNCVHSSWTFLYANQHWQWAVRDLGNGKCQIEPYHEWYEEFEFEDWYYSDHGSQLCHVVIDFGAYYDGYTSPSDPFGHVIGDNMLDLYGGDSGTISNPGHNFGFHTDFYDDPCIVK